MILYWDFAVLLSREETFLPNQILISRCHKVLWMQCLVFIPLTYMNSENIMEGNGRRVIHSVFMIYIHHSLVFLLHSVWWRKKETRKVTVWRQTVRCKLWPSVGWSPKMVWLWHLHQSTTTKTQQHHHLLPTSLPRHHNTTPCHHHHHHPHHHPEVRATPQSSASPLPSSNTLVPHIPVTLECFPATPMQLNPSPLAPWLTSHPQAATPHPRTPRGSLKPGSWRLVCRRRTWQHPKKWRRRICHTSTSRPNQANPMPPTLMPSSTTATTDSWPRLWVQLFVLWSFFRCIESLVTFPLCEF